MNIQPGNIRVARKRKTNSSAELSLQLAPYLGAVVKLVLFGLVVACILNAYIYLNQQITATDRQIGDIRKEIVRTEREIELLRSRREQLTSWSHISKMIARYHLNLTLPGKGQVNRMALIPPTQAGKTPVASSVRGVPAGVKSRSAQR